jgi:hypothetical protein
MRYAICCSRTLPCSKLTAPWRTNIVSLRCFSKRCGFQTLCSLLGPSEGRKGFTKTKLTFLTLCVMKDHHYKYLIFKNLTCVFSFKQSLFYLTRHNIFGKSSRGTPVGRWKPADNEPWRRLLKWSEVKSHVQFVSCGAYYMNVSPWSLFIGLRHTFVLCPSKSSLCLYV